MNHSQKTIVIFDDDEDILSICSFILEEQGWKVFGYTDCNKITEKISSILPDIIIMDNWIPDDGGIIATQTLKKNSALKDIPVIYFSANNNVEELASEAGADDFLAKPFDISAMESIVRKYA